MKTLRISLLLLLLTFTFSTAASAQDSPRVIATTSILADVASAVGGGLITVETLLPPGTDTHAYQPGVEDAARIAEADLLLVVGAGYEAFLGGLLESAGADVPVIVASNDIEILAYGDEHGHEDEEGHAEEDHMDEASATAEAAHESEEAHADEAHPHYEVLGILGADLECEAHDDHEETAKLLTRARDDAEGTPSPDSETGDDHDDEHAHGECDPHVWMNPLNVITWATNIAEAFATLDSANAETYRANAAAYAAQLEALDQEIQELVAELPEERRVLVTNHEFLRYFAAQYGFEVVATVLPANSTGAEADPQRLAELITQIQAEAIPAIFAEVSANAQLAELVASEAGAVIVSTLYTESLSEPEGEAGTYLDYMRYNARTIVEALR